VGGAPKSRANGAEDERPAAPQVDAKNPNTTTSRLTSTRSTEEESSGFAWMMYSMIRGTYRGDTFKENFPDEKEYRHTLKERMRH